MGAEVYTISLRKWNANPDAFAFYYPLLAYECEMAKIEQDDDAIQEAVLKLLDKRSCTPKSLGGMLSLPEGVLQRVFDVLEQKGLLQHTRQIGWRLTRPLEQALEMLESPNTVHKAIGYLFFDPLSKELCPYIYFGNVLERVVVSNLPTLMYRNKAASFEVSRLEPYDSRWQKAYRSFYKFWEAAERVRKERERREETPEEGQEIISLSPAEMGFEEAEDPREEPAAPQTDWVFLDHTQTLVKPFHKPPLHLWAETRVLWEKDTAGGCYIQSPFPLEEQDFFEFQAKLKNNDELKQNVWLEMPKQGEKKLFWEFLEGEVNKRFPHILAVQKTVEEQMAERWPLVGALRGNAAYPLEYRRCLEGFEDLVRPPERLSFKFMRGILVLVDGLEGWMECVLETQLHVLEANPSLKRQVEAALRNYSDCALFYGNYFSNTFDDQRYRMINGMLREALKKLKSTSHGNSALQKMLNILWLDHRGCRTPESTALLAREGLDSFFDGLNRLNRIRTLYSHSGRTNPQVPSEQKMQEDYRFLQEHFYPAVARILQSLGVSTYGEKQKK